MMLHRVALLVLCLGLVAAGVGKRRKNKRLARLRPCTENEFQCANGHCIDSVWTCDTNNDCGDHSDERLPECPPRGECTGEHEFECLDHKDCLPIDFRCDGEDDCWDGSDERDCDKFTCTKGEWHCQNGRCVDEDYLCDGDNDCVDGSDELPENCHGHSQAP